MIEINLLKYLNKTFSEIYEIEHQVIFDEEKPKKISFSKIYIIFGTVLLVVAIIVTYFLILNDVERTHQTKKSLKKIDNLSTKIDNTEKSMVGIEGFKPIGTIEFKKKTVSNNNKDKEEVIMDKLETKLKQPEPISKKPELVRKEKLLTKTSQHQESVNKYAIVIEKLTEKEFFLLKNRIKNRSLKENKIVEDIEKWQVFVEKKGTNNFIGQLEVKLEKEFSDRDSAVNFAKSLDKKVVVKKDVYDKISYNIEIAYFDSVQEAKNYISSLGIKGKVIKLIKKSN